MPLQRIPHGSSEPLASLGNLTVVAGAQGGAESPMIVGQSCDLITPSPMSIVRRSFVAQCLEPPRPAADRHSGLPLSAALLPAGAHTPRATQVLRSGIGRGRFVTRHGLEALQ